jgi:hypothetical protein
MLCKSVPFTAEDFRSQAERERALDATGEDACTRHGLSVFPTFKSCDHLRRALPRLGSHILRARLSPNHGVIAETPSRKNPQHQTWWPFEGTPRDALFAAVDDGGSPS